MLNIALFGPPGAGKGTQSEFLISKYNLFYISTGDLLRKEMANDTKLGREAKSIIAAGGLVPDEIIVQIIEKTITDNPGSNGFLFDGFPRTVDQAKALDELLNSNGTPISGMLSLEVEKRELISRLVSRGKISGRADDQDEAIIENRINVYNQKTLPLIEYYKPQGKYFGINGMGSIAEIADRLKKVIEKI